MAISWTNDLNTGINVIDKQHMRIVDYINQLEIAKINQNKQLLKQVVNECVDYTLSHFAFEESLQEEAGYAFCKPHKRVHELFARKVGEYQQRLDLGDDVADELHETLERWLVNHIKRDDADYVRAVKANMTTVIKEQEQDKGTGWFGKFFS
jgi:hemerythrin